MHYHALPKACRLEWCLKKLMRCAEKLNWIDSKSRRRGSRPCCLKFGLLWSLWDWLLLLWPGPPLVDDKQSHLQKEQTGQLVQSFSLFSMCFHHRVIPLGRQCYFSRFAISNRFIQTRNSILDPPDAQLGLTRRRSFLAGAGSALVESTADNAGANLWIMLGNSNESKIFGFWVD